MCACLCVCVCVCACVYVCAVNICARIGKGRQSQLRVQWAGDFGVCNQLYEASNWTPAEGEGGYNNQTCTDKEIGYFKLPIISW